MSGPVGVELVAWSGDVAQLAARLRMPESDLLRQLRRVARSDKSRLVVNVTPANSSPILAALARRLNEEPAA